MPSQKKIYDVCPSCGDLVAALDDETGWCDACAGVTPTQECKICGKPGTTICSHCKYIEWLERNANAIELAMATHGMRANAAKRYVVLKNRPICHSCKQPIKGGTGGRHFFCTTTEACVRAGSVYHYHRRVARRTHEESIHRAVTAAYVVKLTSSKVIRFG